MTSRPELLTVVNVVESPLPRADDGAFQPVVAAGLTAGAAVKVGTGEALTALENFRLPAGAGARSMGGPDSLAAVDPKRPAEKYEPVAATGIEEADVRAGSLSKENRGGL